MKEDLLGSDFADKRLDYRIALEIFHIIRDRRISPLYRIIAIDKGLYNYM